MYLHIGNNVILRKKQVLGIFDMDNATVSPVTRAYLARAQVEQRVNSVSFDIPKSFILYNKDGQITVYFSPLSEASLMGRMRSEFSEKDYSDIC